MAFPEPQDRLAPKEPEETQDVACPVPTVYPEQKEIVAHQDLVETQASLVCQVPKVSQEIQATEAPRATMASQDDQDRQESRATVANPDFQETQDWEARDLKELKASLDNPDSQADLVYLDVQATQDPSDRKEAEEDVEPREVWVSPETEDYQEHPVIEETQETLDSQDGERMANVESPVDQVTQVSPDLTDLMVSEVPPVLRDREALVVTPDSVVEMVLLEGLVTPVPRDSRDNLELMACPVIQALA